MEAHISMSVLQNYISVFNTIASYVKGLPKWVLYNDAQSNPAYLHLDASCGQLTIMLYQHKVLSLKLTLEADVLQHGKVRVSTIAFCQIILKLASNSGTVSMKVNQNPKQETLELQSNNKTVEVQCMIDVNALGNTMGMELPIASQDLNTFKNTLNVICNSKLKKDNNFGNTLWILDKSSDNISIFTPDLIGFTSMVMPCDYFPSYKETKKKYLFANSSMKALHVFIKSLKLASSIIIVKNEEGFGFFASKSQDHNGLTVMVRYLSDFVASNSSEDAYISIIDKLNSDNLYAVCELDTKTYRTIFMPITAFTNGNSKSSVISFGIIVQGLLRSNKPFDNSFDSLSNCLYLSLTATFHFSQEKGFAQGALPLRIHYSKKDYFFINLPFYVGNFITSIKRQTICIHIHNLISPSGKNIILLRFRGNEEGCEHYFLGNLCDVNVIPCLEEKYE